MAPIGLYLHVPFCRSKCPYCDFYSLPFSDDLAQAYTDAAIRAMDRWPGPRRGADTVYLGGGTPSLLGADRLAGLLAAADRVFGLAQGAEITLEANPGTVDASLLGELRQAGYNRISLGMQSAQETELELLGRIHRADDTARAVALARRAGFDNLSLDLMLGTPCQTVDSALASARDCAALGADHVSAYLLKVEPGTPYGLSGPPGPCMDDDQQADCYLAVCAQLESLGYSQYEISNFAKLGRASRHNSKYWSCDDYLGIGPSAHSLMDGRRFFFPRDLPRFLAEEQPWSGVEEEGVGHTKEEYIMLQLRLCQGLDLDKLAAQWPQADTSRLLERAKPFLEGNLARMEGRVLRLTREGFLLSNAILAELL